MKVRESGTTPAPCGGTLVRMVSVSKVQRALVVLALAVNAWMYVVWALDDESLNLGFALAGALPLVPLLAGRRPRSFVGLTLAVVALYAAGWIQYWTEERWSDITWIDAIQLTPAAVVLVAASLAPRRLTGERRAMASAWLALSITVVGLLVCLAVMGALADVQFEGGLPEADVE